MPDPMQRLLGLLASALTLPLVAALALAVRLDSPGPAIYAARRVGAGGREFRCRKLRTMRIAADRDGALTVAGDDRVTRIGRLLRRTRLDELPQLWHVAAGTMRLVGPRPEDPRFVDLELPLHREVFTARPGITGLTQLVYTEEGAMLVGADPETTYRERILPAKLRIDALYLRHRSSALDLWTLAHTPLAILGRPIALPGSIGRELAALGGTAGE
jgi:lipopolysaccharide/colanic/teichoic acid biosynthesis glycosyltransferase